MKDLMHINDKDNLLTCLKPLLKGETVEFEGVMLTASSDIPIFHKIAAEKINKGEYFYKYGEIIGKATCDINPGDYVHTHNLESTRGRGDSSNNDGEEKK